jgi:hypothetical protein
MAMQVHRSAMALVAENLRVCFHGAPLRGELDAARCCVNSTAVAVVVVAVVVVVLI